ncbi:ModE family transcriptional regulator [Methylophaga lonarensis MPL]|uniref:ModE family transcriptional regulator n=1 Tax=Methylophaga lonarensis MPL TaxID=1286106 RepID=M7PIM0_9GAMM|nr:winged helix-turn-helix domain-containing protein [Methylophaga lonarensis]EMR13735.1 ModE family transcriptional regulator [Methylophaga lonarensis MPL]
MMVSNEAVKASLKIRLHRDDLVAIGPGKADLLQAIIEQGSISAAARSMNMSYKRAWDLVNVMNESFQQPLVSTVTGGSHGGGAQVTEFGKQILQQYQAIQQKANAAVADDLAMLGAQLR